VLYVIIEWNQETLTGGMKSFQKAVSRGISRRATDSSCDSFARGRSS
jgi:hypothetical protein